MEKSYVIGLDYGSDSVRAVLVDAGNGEEMASSVFYYPRWKKGAFCDASASQFRQHPLDYIEGLEATVKDCLAKTAGVVSAQQVKAISVDTTGSTPIAVDEKVFPWCLGKSLPIIRMPCLCCGRIILRCRKHNRSMSMRKNLI